MSQIIQYLREFNRKERFFLVGFALGNRDFRLSPAFREELGRVLRLDIPEDAFTAMDYHLDWVYASVFLAMKSDASPVYPLIKEMVAATQQDIDLLVAYEGRSGCHLFFLEAKGVGNFTNQQMDAKASRLRKIFEAKEVREAGVVPHFAIVSPYKPQKLTYEGWPDWMLDKDGEASWVKLRLPRQLKKITRCQQDGTISRNGQYWKVSEEHAHQLRGDRRGRSSCSSTASPRKNGR